MSADEILDEMEKFLDEERHRELQRGSELIETGFANLWQQRSDRVYAYLVALAKLRELRGKEQG